MKFRVTVKSVKGVPVISNKFLTDEDWHKKEKIRGNKKRPEEISKVKSRIEKISYILQS